jgi:hypothetical protein
MTVLEKIRMHFPNATLRGSGGSWCVVNRCWPGVSVRLCSTEDQAREILRTGICTAPKCLGPENHTVQEFETKSVGDWHD